ncbi:MAG: alkaline shock response membrane anchor protein AmaP [Finegoldia magna]|nr:alkaline shock response membrane anchor protein AmaP [Finegoldia magna]
MSGFKKFVHILFSILLILFSLVMFFTVFNFGQVSYNLRELTMNEVCFYILAVIGALILIGALIIMFKAILSDNLSDFLISKDKDGEVMISTDALENTVKSTVNKFNDVRTSNVNVRVNNSNEPYMNCDVEVGVRDMSNVGGLGETIKNDIKTNLETLTGYKVKDITVKFLDLAKSTNKRVV